LSDSYLGSPSKNTLLLFQHRTALASFQNFFDKEFNALLCR